MRFKELTLRNFGSFYGEQLLEFPAQGLLLIAGENMWGKTTLLNAVKWAMYGEVEDRLGNPVLRKNLVNWDAAETGDWTLEVKLSFESEGSSYIVERSLGPRNTDPAPKANKDFVENLFLRINGVTVPTDDGQNYLSTILPRDVSRFFLFDGEMLDDYEELLIDSSKQSQTIKDSIEAILGIPALTNSVDDVSKVARGSQQKQRVLAQQDERAKGEAARAEELAETRDSTEKDQKINEQDLITKGSELVELNQWLNDQSGAEHDVQKLTLVEQELKKLQERITQAEVRGRETATNAWLDLVEPAKSEALNYAQQKLTSALEMVSARSSLEHQRENLMHMLDEKNCPVCEREISNEIDVKYKSQLSSIKSKLDSSPVSEDEIQSIKTTIARLGKIKSFAAGPILREIETQISNDLIDLVKKESDRDRLQKNLANHDRSQIAKRSKRRIQLIKDIGFRENTAKKLKERLAGLESELLTTRRKMSSSGGPQLSRLNKEVALFDSLGDAIDAGISVLRDRLRGDIQASATRAFKQMTTEDGYAKLEINNTYGLSIIDTTGRAVPLRSAGAEQIVALSLVSALNKSAVRQAPVMMDTPFGRLDSGHRANVLSYAAEMAEQVVLLVHSGELDSKRDFGLIEGKVASVYHIKRLTESRSALVKGESND
jgi:DNA sulfur modification protein DndD